MCVAPETTGGRRQPVRWWDGGARGAPDLNAVAGERIPLPDLGQNLWADGRSRQAMHMYIKEELRFRIGGAAPNPPEFTAFRPE